MGSLIYPLSNYFSILRDWEGLHRMADWHFEFFQCNAGVQGPLKGVVFRF